MKCSICPRLCGVDRAKQNGRCGVGEDIYIARAALHNWEEPCISGTRGSGTVFFSGCNLRCVYCQNHEISRGRVGRKIAADELRRIYADLAAQGAHNINLVTPTHYTMQILPTLGDIPIPVVWNSSAYELPETVRLLKGKVQIFLPDLKYGDAETAKYSDAPDYFDRACAAIEEMYSLVGEYRLDKDGIMKKGVLIRHLILPGRHSSTRRVIDWVADSFGDRVMFSLMSQYIPCMGDVCPELNRRITPLEYKAAMRYMEKRGINCGYVQAAESADEMYVPPFDLTEPKT